MRLPGFMEVIEGLGLGFSYHMRKQTGRTDKNNGSSGSTGAVLYVAGALAKKQWQESHNMYYTLFMAFQYFDSNSVKVVEEWRR